MSESGPPDAPDPSAPPPVPPADDPRERPSTLALLRAAAIEGVAGGLAATLASVVLDAIRWPVQPHLWTVLDALGFCAIGVVYAAVRRATAELPPGGRVVWAVIAGAATDRSSRPEGRWVQVCCRPLEHLNLDGFGRKLVDIVSKPLIWLKKEVRLASGAL